MKSLFKIFILLLATNLLAFNLMDIFSSSSSYENYIPKRDETTTNNAKLSLKYVSYMKIKDDMGNQRRENAIYLINEFMSILQNNSFKNAVTKSLPLVHKSLLTKNQKDLDDDTKRFSFKKAHERANYYNFPIAITRIDKLKTTEIGYGNTYEKGIEYKIWIAKKESKGYPAPIVVFFREGSENPKISYVGSI